MTDIAKMPHMLIGGQTGSGKSVFIRNIIQSLNNCEVDIIDMKGLDFERFRQKYYLGSVRSTNAGQKAGSPNGRALQE